MKIGILLTDHVMDELKAKHGDMDDFYKYIFNKVDPTIKLEIFDVVEGIYPKDIEECQGYLITGSRFSVYDEVDWIK
ncbi:MAG: GMP synthase, partial [SAR86 cluster bacterium]